MDLDPTGSSYPGGPQGKFFPFGSRVLFYATTPATGQELFVTDGSAAGTTLVADLHPGPTGSYVNLLSMLGTRHAYFDVYDGGSLTQLWRTDGSGRGTQQLGDVRGGPPVLSGGKILLAATTALTGRELYRYDAGATAQPLGHGCGIAPPYPYLTANDPVLGATCTLRGERFPDDRTALVVVALPAAPLELSPGCNSYIDLGQTVATHALRTAGSRWVLRFAVPADPALAGVVLAAQAWVGPAGTPLGVEFASAVQLTLGV
jgi:ELWxxDGT repeat protein